MNWIEFVVNLTINLLTTIVNDTGWTKFCLIYQLSTSKLASNICFHEIPRSGNNLDIFDDVYQLREPL